jgi:uncharacterized coiled-coil protein SlyX
MRAIVAEHRMEKVETPREAALRRIAKQEARIARQRLVIAGLDRAGIASGQAKRLLATMQETLAALRTSLDHLRS